MTEVRELDDADHGEWYAVYAEAYSRPFDAPWLEAEKRVNLTDDEYGTKVTVAAWHHGRIVGGGAVVMPLKDNMLLAYVDLFTHSEHRRQGHGTAMLAAIMDIARDHGRSRVFVEALWGVDESTAAGHEFLLARGSAVDLVDAVRTLDLPAVVPAAPVAAGYVLRTWRGPCPDAERVRRDEDDAARSGRLMQVTIAQSATGVLVGHTQLSIPSDSPEVFQWDTLVLGEHRGHGLGLTLKAANMRAAADVIEGRSRIMTYNAASNAPMIAVNEALGFRQIAWSAEHLLEIE